jgi:response regulator RpfG family c-di-GMP phosphodiesterase
MLGDQETQSKSDGILLGRDAVRALALRKYSLTLGMLLRGFTQPEEVLERVHANGAAFVLIDLSEPLPDAGDLIRHLVNHFPSVPVVAILPERASEELRREVIGAGVRDFLVMPFGIEEYQMRMRNALRVVQQETVVSQETVSREEEIRDAIGQILLREYETLYVLGKAAEYKDEDTGSHILRVAHYAKLIAKVIGESESKQDVILHSSALHDIGKLGIPDTILLKPAKLTDDEFAIMKTHTTSGHGILEHSASTYLLTGAMIALTHHERYNGLGYPMGLSGAEIPAYGRIVCIADVFDALTTQRPYKGSWSLDRAFALLISERARQFDPDLVDAFVCNAPNVEAIFYKHTES